MWDEIKKVSAKSGRLWTLQRLTEKDGPSNEASGEQIKTQIKDQGRAGIGKKREGAFQERTYVKVEPRENSLNLATWRSVMTLE